MNRQEKLKRIRKEIEELKELKKELILSAGYSSVDAYYIDYEKRNGIKINNENQNKPINFNSNIDKEQKNKQNILMKFDNDIDKAA